MSAGPNVAGPLASLASAVRALTQETVALRADVRVLRSELARLSVRLTVAVLEAERRRNPLEVRNAEEITEAIHRRLMGEDAP